MDDVTTEEYEHIPENWDVHSCMSEENAKASNLEDHTDRGIQRAVAIHLRSRDIG